MHGALSPLSESFLETFLSFDVRVALPKDKAGDIRDTGSVPGLGRSPGGARDNPLQYSCLMNPVDRGAWQTIVHRFAKSDMTEAT